MPLAHRIRTLALATLGWLVVACLAASVAFAASTYSEMTPAPGSSTQDTTPFISVKVADPAGIWFSGAQLKIDGLLRTPRVKWGAGYVILTYQQTTPLANGPHSVYASVFTGAGRTSTTWSFNVGAAPTIGAMVPADGSLVDTQMPAISAPLESHGNAISEFAMTVDGAAVPATYDVGADTITYTPSTELENGVSHTAAVQVTYASGDVLSAQTTFDVQIYPSMPDGYACDDCHVGFPTAHPVDNCLACHGEGGPYWTDYNNPADSHAPGTYCSNCHGNLSDCASCHEGPYPTVPRHVADLDAAHQSTSDPACGDCHLLSLTYEHMQHTDEAGDPYTCLTCHASTDANVQAAIAAGSTACGDCHTFADGGGHESLHELERTDTCVDCHEGASLTSVHLGAGLSCGTCHDSTDPEVVAAIASGTLECSACHTTQGVDYHLNMAVHYAPDSYETCGHCHHAWGSSPVRGPDVTRHAGGCTTCHNDTMDLTGLTTACANCHDQEGVNYHYETATRHTPVDENSLDCARCHQTTDVREIHTTWGCETCHYTYSCSECHSMHGGSGGALEIATSCNSCHTVAGTDYHSGFDAAHTFADMDAGCQADGCHSASLVDAHASLVGDTGRYPQYSDTCALCHLNDDPDRIPAGATADCTSCHELHGELGEIHTAATLTGYVDLVGAINVANPYLDCVECHGTAEEIATWVHNNGAGQGTNVNCEMCHTTTNLLELHSQNCAWCHGTNGPRASFTDWDQTCQQGDCHPTLHPNARSGHDLVDCYQCHNHPRTFDFVTDRCGNCHTLNDIIAPVTTSNAIPFYTGPATITLSATDEPAIGGSGLAGTYYRLDGGAQTAGTSIYVPVPASGSQLHALEFWSVDVAGNVETSHIVTFTVINGADTNPPTGTMSVNNGAAYTTSRGVQVNSNVTDNETAVSQMRVDPGTGTFGTWVSYSANYAITLPNSTGTKTVRAQYRDYSGNVLQLTDTIMLDLVAPVTTSNTASNYTGNASITLSATDVGSGVAHTYYRLDGGAQTEGTSISVAAPASGSVQHSLEYWSVDNSGRTEIHHTDVFVVLSPSAQLGSIAFTPNYPEDIDSYDWEIRTAGGTVVASGNQSTPVVSVPVSATAYTVQVDYIWYGEPERTEIFSALVDYAGKTVYIVFN